MATLENWSVVGAMPSLYSAPEQTEYCLHGEVYDHPDKDRHEDGKIVKTSRIVDTKEAGRVVITHSGTEYKLGEPSQDYVMWLQKTQPDVFERWDGKSVNFIKT